MNNRVFMDYNATAPARPEVREKIVALMAQPANPSSAHGFGRLARAAIEKARAHVATLAGARPDQVIFNSGATESNNTVLRHFGGRPVAASAIEHPSVLDAAPDAIRIPVTQAGEIDLTALKTIMRSNDPPALVSIMAVNNETGIIQPIDKISALVKEAGAALHVDAAQAAGRLKLRMNLTGIDYMSLSAHKIGGPQGAGALIAGPCAEPPVLLHGGGQEKRRRAGTENTAGIAGFGEAARLAVADIEDGESIARLSRWRDRLESEIAHITPAARFFGQDSPRIANTSMLALPGIPAANQLMALDMEGIAVSNGSACSSGRVSAGHVLLAMGVPEEIAGCSLRVSLGWATQEQDIDRFLSVWEKFARRVQDKIHH